MLLFRDLRSFRLFPEPPPSCYRSRIMALKCSKVDHL
jgi:hypothetical protein